MEVDGRSAPSSSCAICLMLSPSSAPGSERSTPDIGSDSRGRHTSRCDYFPAAPRRVFRSVPAQPDARARTWGEVGGGAQSGLGRRHHEYLDGRGLVLPGAVARPVLARRGWLGDAQVTLLGDCSLVVAVLIERGGAQVGYFVLPGASSSNGTVATPYRAIPHARGARKPVDSSIASQAEHQHGSPYVGRARGVAKGPRMWKSSDQRLGLGLMT